MTNLSLEMLVVRAEHMADDTGRLFGFWYLGQVPLPETKQEQLQYFHHLTSRHCFQTEINGPWSLVQEVIDTSANRSINRQHAKNWLAYCTHIASGTSPHQVELWFDDLGETKGTFFELHASLWVAESEAALLDQIKKGRDVVKMTIESV